MVRRGALGLGVLVAVAATAASAAAQPADVGGPPATADAAAVPPAAAGGGSAEVDEARRHMETGQDLYGQGQYVLAAQEFLAANTIHASSAFVFNVGLCYMQAGDGPNALKYLRQYLAMEPDAPDRAAIEQRLAEIEASLAAAPPPPPEGAAPAVVITHETAAESRERMKSMLSVETVPDGAHIAVQDAGGAVIVEGTSPMTRALSAGDYVLRIEHPDFATEQTDIHVRPGGVYGYYYRLGQRQYLGFLRIVADQPGARIFVDSHEAGAARVTPYQEVLPVGPHEVWVELAGFQPAEQSVEVSLGGSSDVAVHLERVSFGELLVLTNVEGATIAFDGGEAQAAQASADFGAGVFGMLRSLPAGRHAVRVAAEDMKDYAEEIDVGSGQRTRLLVRLNPSPSRVSAWVSFGIAAACLGAGGAFGGVALDIQDGIDHDRAAGRLDNNDPRILKGLLWSVGADSAFLAGAVMTGLGLYYLLRDPLPPSEGRQDPPVDFSSIDGWRPTDAPPPPTTPPVEVLPTTGPTGLGLGLEVRF